MLQSGKRKFSLTLLMLSILGFEKLMPLVRVYLLSADSCFCNINLFLVLTGQADIDWTSGVPGSVIAHIRDQNSLM